MTDMTLNLGRFYINGRWVEPNSDKLFPVINPTTEEHFGMIYLANAADVEVAVAAAKAAFEACLEESKAVRLARLERLIEVSQQRLEDMAQAMVLEMGAPISFARDMQADAAVGHLQGFIDALKQQNEREEWPNGDVLVREPIGVCGLITPWNWPINQIALKVIPALAVGATCVLKPSEHTPLSADIYAEIIDEAGFPPGSFNLIHGDGPSVGSALSRHPDIHMMSFTGSTRAGTAVTKDAADTVKRVTLELGGKSPNLVFADCDLEQAIVQGVAECFLNTGQSCDAPTRMLVERSIYDQAVQLATKVVRETRIADPNEEGDHLGPLFDKIQFDRVQALINAGIDEGAELLVGGPGKPDGFEKGWFVKPTLFANVKPEMRIVREEIFGPVLVMMPFDTEDEAITMANDTPYGLAGFVQTGSRERAERVAAKLRVGAVHINGGAYNYGSPFGGYKQSGNGREGGPEGLADYQEIKTIHWG
ncbi:MAG: aldehyde dehydrogenase family protein [Hyphomicrobiaceae bacterium TMED74]|nr:aldehyde dehydrogenase family protein [Filomicrobium sp.]RPG45147.1 MAG: aldehyde dehydrogenase family protein [Hyphomicrobiaceae bacterium TMED74]